MFDRKRRAFITLVGGAAAGWPFAARAQQRDRMRRIGVLTTLTSDDPEFQARNAAFLQALQELGWTVGRNVRIDYRFSAGVPERTRKLAEELVALRPDIILAIGSPAVASLQQLTQDVPIVFVNVGAGFVDSLARPGGNITGFMQFEYSLGGKWLELLKEIVPRLQRAAILRDSATIAGGGQFGAIQSVASSLGVEVRPISVRDAAEIERGIAGFAHDANSGLIVPGSGLAVIHSDLIVALAARHRLPAIYWARFHVAAGGLISYGSETVDQYRRAVAYVDRILKGEKPADLPVQAPTKYELVINLNTAKALGIDLPASVLARADEVIE
jgi:putative tryptophan/tyrosine transport system substrate-binding protein